jgi:ATP-dependent Lhr-like helicase
MPPMPGGMRCWWPIPARARRWRVHAHAGGVLPLAALGEAPPEGLHTLYISPLKALAHDVQRNLLTPIAEMGLNLRVETRSGDTPSDRKARQRAKPPQVLLTTPESLSLLLSYPEASEIFSGLKRVVIDEIHAFATGSAAICWRWRWGGCRRSAPVCNAPRFRPRWPSRKAFAAGWRRGARSTAWPWSRARKARRPSGNPVAAGRARAVGRPCRRLGRAATDRNDPRQPRHAGLHQHALSGRIYLPALWDANEGNLPIGIHHGSLSVEARRKVEGAMARGELRALVCTASLDLGVDWGDIDLVVQMGAPKGSSRLLQRIGRANHRLDLSSRAVLVPGNRFEYLEAMAARDAVHEGQRDGEDFRPGGLDVLAQHVMGCACAGPFREAGCCEKCAPAPLCLGGRDGLCPRARFRGDRRLFAARL